MGLSEQSEFWPDGKWVAPSCDKIVSLILSAALLQSFKNYFSEKPKEVDVRVQRRVEKTSKTKRKWRSAVEESFGCVMNSRGRWDKSLVRKSGFQEIKHNCQL